MVPSVVTQTNVPHTFAQFRIISGIEEFLNFLTSIFVLPRRVQIEFETKYPMKAMHRTLSNRSHSRTESVSEAIQ